VGGTQSIFYGQAQTTHNHIGTQIHLNRQQQNNTESLHDNRGRRDTDDSIRSGSNYSHSYGNTNQS
jgi:hypothetical protein